VTKESTVFDRFPGVLKNPEFRFIIIRKKEKAALEKKWTFPEHQYEYITPKFQYYLQQGFNYGVIFGHGDLCCFDADELETLDQMGILDIFASPGFSDVKTFTVRTSKGYHFYFKCKAKRGKIPIYEKGTQKHLGEFYTSGAFYCVGPGSIHPSGDLYRVVQNRPLMEISEAELDAILEIFDTTEKEEKPIPATFTNYDRNDSVVGKLGLRIEHFVPLGKEVGNGEYVTSHPVHGSTTGTNLSVNPSKNLWCCRRCNSGGDPLTWVAVEEGIIRCSDAQSGCLSDLVKDEWEVLWDALGAKGYRVDEITKKPALPKWMADIRREVTEEIAAKKALQTKFVKNVSDFRW
jgi:hypothetical protein